MIDRIPFEELELPHNKWIKRFLNLAKNEVAQWSKDPSTKVAAVVAEGNRLISVGYNGAPPGLDDEFALRDRETKIACTIHAEHNAMDFSGREYLNGCTLYITHPPCDRCAAQIIKRRVSRVVYIDPDPEMRKRWNCDFSEHMLIRAGVDIVKVS